MKILETVGTLIQAAGNIAKQQLNPTAAIGGAGAALAFAPEQKFWTFYIKIEQVIEPGVYRVQKSWERVAATPTDGLGLHEVEGMFSDIGLVVHEVRSVITRDQFLNEAFAADTKAQKAGAVTIVPVQPKVPTSP